MKAQIIYLPLGDSYSIGEGIAPEENFPSVLTQKLRAQGHDFVLAANPCVTGYTTADLIKFEFPEVIKYRPHAVTLLIGVNDWVQGVDEATFEKNLDYILKFLLSRGIKILLVTIPDFSVTPKGGPLYARGRNISQGLQKFNDIIQKQATAHSLPVADIFPLSQSQGKRPECTAADGLHPSGVAYREWAEKIILPLAPAWLK